MQYAIFAFIMKIISLGLIMVSIPLQKAESDGSSDITFDYVLPACARISKALKSSFEPFLSVVLPPCLQGATAVVQFTVEDADADDVEGEVSFFIKLPSWVR